MTKTTVTVTVTSEVEVPQEDWIDYLTQYPDIFMHGYIGYWACGVSKNDEGWLLWEIDEHLRRDERDALFDSAEKAWESGSELPPGFFKLDKAAAVKSFEEGCKRWGVNWFENADGNNYDVALQLALLGEIRYG